MCLHLLMADAFMHRSVNTYRAIIKYYFCLIWLYILLSALIAIAFISFCGVLILLEVVDLHSHVRGTGLLHGPLLLPWLHSCTLASCYFGLYPGKLVILPLLIG